MGAGGRPTKYKEEYSKQVYKLCLLGATDKDIADYFEVDESTINNWKNEHTEFFESIKRGKVDADATVAERLYSKAKGYDQKTDKIFQFQGEPVIVPTIEHVQPDTTAAIFWLKNRQSAKWRDKTEVDANVNNNITVEPPKFE